MTIVYLDFITMRVNYIISCSHMHLLRDVHRKWLILMSILHNNWQRFNVGWSSHPCPEMSDIMYVGV